MTVSDVIKDYKNKNPGTPYTDEQLTVLVSALDRMIQSEILHTFPYVVTDNGDGTFTKTDGTLVGYDYDDDKDTAVLLSGTPFEDLYLLYVTSMVLFYQADWIRYSNAKSMFNARYADTAKYYSRTILRPQQFRLRNYW